MPRIIFLKKDVTGLLPGYFFIQDEFRLTESGNSRLVIPDYGAFFEKDSEVRHADTQRNRRLNDNRSNTR